MISFIIKYKWTLVFGIIMLCIFFGNLKSKDIKKKKGVSNYLAALGIIGTFWGITLALIHFETNDIESSIPKLMEGLKTAFFTSLLGLSLSNIFKYIRSREMSKEGKSKEDFSLERIAELMLEIKDSIATSNENNLKSMGQLVESLVGENDKSLTTQMKSLKDDMIKAQYGLTLGLTNMGKQLGSLVESNNAISEEIKRGNEVLIEEFRSFAKDMAENNMKAFTEAIQECIRDLNNQLQEQFGENFKQLNLAVEKLLEWQVHYKETVEKTNVTQEELYKGIKEAELMVTMIMGRTESIVEVANKLGDKIVTFDTQETKLNNSIELLNKVSEEARVLLPNLDGYINKYYENTNATIESVDNINKKVLDNINNTMERVEEVNKESAEKITEHVVDTTTRGIEEINKASTTVLEAVNEVHKEATQELGKLSNVIDTKVLENLEVINEMNKETDRNTKSILENISRINKSVEESAIEISENVNENRKEIVKLAKTTTEEIKNQQSNITNTIDEITREIRSSSNLNIKSIEQQLRSMETAILKLESEGITITTKISDNIQTMVENNNNNLQTSVNNLNEALESTLNASLQSLGNQLASVSEKFVSDYTPLTEELRRVVEIAKRVR